MTIWTLPEQPLRGTLYRSIADQISSAIESGDLAPGERLPTHRDLAQQLGVSVHTVSQAYAEAERRGLITGEIGRGTFVRVGPSEREARFVMERRTGDLIDLSINRPVTGGLPDQRIRDVMRDLAEDDLSSMLVCRPIPGMDAHRETAALWLRRRVIEIDPARILVTNGVAHGLMVALAALTRPGDVVLTEALVDHGLIGLSGVLHFRLEGVAIDEEGILPDALEAACAAHEVRALCVTPCLNNPTVGLMGAGRRREIARIARRFDLTLVENDIYGMLPEDSPAPLWRELPDRTCYVTSFTKTTVSGLRTGYLAAPEAMLPRLVRCLRATSWMATPLVAEIASRWVRDGSAMELVAWQRKAVAGRQTVLRELLKGFRYVSHPESLHAWLTLPESWRAETFVSEARLRNVAVTPAEPFVVGHDTAPRSIRISVGAATSEAELRRGLEILAGLLQREPEPFYMPT